jgi:hypothetical protein
MKKALLIFSLMCSFFILQAQNEGTLIFNAYGSYSFTDKVHFDNAYTKVQEGFQWGTGFEFFPIKNKSFELKYLRLSTHFPLYMDNGTQILYGNDKGSLNYILFGVNNYFGKKADAKILPYAGMEAGLGLISREYTRWRFAWGGKVGVKIKTSSVMSLNLHTYFQSIVSSFGSDSWPVVPGSGVVVVVPNYAAIFQIGIGGALCFDLTNAKLFK